ncbi:hypothetical protein DFH07DRAFT_949095 [Mycena maculata]|uniref:Uncharacterized protein n=1 Tax=Mycena maculata TaxID=230809 RepID=A0AAD7P069_9AGAR|nr:hypothetical protein DFH07DRAFT_949095 [Mycena maculata]
MSTSSSRSFRLTLSFFSPFHALLSRSFLVRSRTSRSLRRKILLLGVAHATLFFQEGKQVPTGRLDPVPDSPPPTFKTYDKSDDDSVQVVAKPGDHHPVEHPGKFDPAAIEKANICFKGKGSKVLGSLPPAPPIAPTVVAKHLSINPVGIILKDKADDAVHLPPQHPSLATPLECLEKVVLPEAAQAHDEPDDPDANLSMETPGHRSGPASVPKSIAMGTAQVKFGPLRNVPRTKSPAQPSLSSVVLPPPPNLFATQPHDLSSLGWEASTSPGALPSPKAEPVNEPMEEVEENNRASGTEPSFGTPHLFS